MKNKEEPSIDLSKKSIDRFKHRIREITGRSRGISMERRLSERRSFVRGWMGYNGLASQLKLFASLEQWIRRRIRCCYWKRWRHVRWCGEGGQQWPPLPDLGFFSPTKSRSNPIRILARCDNRDDHNRFVIARIVDGVREFFR
jgi:hypothetical protein